MKSITERIQTMSDRARILFRPLLFPWRSGQYFRQRILVDAANYEKCVFVNCTFVYYGEHCHLIDNTLVNCLFEFEGHAAMTVKFIQCLRESGLDVNLNSAIETMAAGTRRKS